jgi:hypothetical protein
MLLIVEIIVHVSCITISSYLTYNVVKGYTELMSNYIPLQGNILLKSQ